jgi:hypothetical protein
MSVDAEDPALVDATSLLIRAASTTRIDFDDDGSDSESLS